MVVAEGGGNDRGGQVEDVLAVRGDATGLMQRNDNRSTRTTGLGAVRANLAGITGLLLSIIQ